MRDWKTCVFSDLKFHADGSATCGKCGKHFDAQWVIETKASFSNLEQRKIQLDLEYKERQEKRKKNPHISQDEEGCTTFEWWSQERKITIYIFNGLLLKSWGTNFSQMEEIMVRDPVKVREAFEWLWK